MATSKKYFHDHLILLLLSTMAFIAVASSIYILLSLASHHTNGYIVQCRDCSNTSAINRRFVNGSVTQLLSFIGFAVIVFVTHFVLSMRTYHIHRQLALGILSLGVLLMVFNAVVSGALLGLL